MEHKPDITNQTIRALQLAKRFTEIGWPHLEQPRPERFEEAKDRLIEALAELNKVKP